MSIKHGKSPASLIFQFHWVCFGRIDLICQIISWSQIKEFKFFLKLNRDSLMPKWNCAINNKLGNYSQPTVTDTFMQSASFTCVTEHTFTQLRCHPHKPLRYLEFTPFCLTSPTPGRHTPPGSWKQPDWQCRRPRRWQRRRPTLTP